MAWILIVISVINGVFWTVYRWNYENHYRQAQLTVDYDDSRTMADAYHQRQDQFLRELATNGITSVGLYDLTLNSYRDNGRVAVTSIEEARQMYPNVNWNASMRFPWQPKYYRFVVTATPENEALLTGQILGHLTQQATAKPITVQLGPGNVGILLPRSQQLMGDAMMGFDPDQVALVHKLGLSVTARVTNPLNLNTGMLPLLFDDIHTTGANVVIFSEDQVLGYDNLYKVVAKEMQKRNLIFGNIEFTKQLGWQDFSKSTDGELVRVHSVGGDEAAKMKVEMMIDRYARAIKERDIRVAYIRLIRQAKGEFREDPATHTYVQTKSPLQQNLDFVKEVRDEIEAQPLPFAFLRPGLVAGQAQAFGDYPLDGLKASHGDRNARIIRYLSAFLSGLGAVGGTLLLLNLFFDLSERARRNWLVLGLLIVAALSLSATMGAKLIALEVGCVFSVVGILWGGLPQLWDASRRRGDGGELGTEISAGRAIVKGCAILVRTSLITFIGPLLIIALLNQWKFMSGTDKYLLPKLTQLLPLLLVGLAFAGEIFPHRVEQEGSAPARHRMRESFKNFLNTPFTIRVAAIAVVLGIVGMIWIARSGNDSGMEISPLELHFRALLERVFITRPRTKEIFVGMPAMIFAAYFALRRQWLLALGAVVLATIGQADMLNTFCHIHTPFFYSLLRSIHGVWLGALVGAIALYIYVACEKNVRGRMTPVSFSTPTADRLQKPSKFAARPGRANAPVFTEAQATIPPESSTPFDDAVAQRVGGEPGGVVVAPHDDDARPDDTDGRSLFYHDDTGRLRRR